MLSSVHVVRGQMLPLCRAIAPVFLAAFTKVCYVPGVPNLYLEIP